MELWIRTQDRTTLIRSYEIYISEQQNKYLLRAKRTSHILGSYETFERALEVLDEIQNILAPKYMIRMDENLNNITNFLNIDVTYIKNDNNADVKNINNTFVYEMPQE